MDECIHSWFTFGMMAAKCEKCGEVRHIYDVPRPQKEQVKITPKITKCNSGYLPVVVVNGHQRGDTYAGNVYSRDDAIQLAQNAAQDAASKYGGDWEITITDLEE